MADPTRFDGCEVVEQLHAGTVSELYRAIQQPLGRVVLIKAVGSAILPSSPFAAALEREARLLAELDHPNIVALHDFVRRTDRMWLVLEHVDGWALDAVLSKVGRLPHDAAVAIALQIARALVHAHERGIIHRDVQPRNLLVSRRGRVKLTSFLVATDERRETAPELLDGGIGYAGPAYMSPEQILGEPTDPRSDVFSLGSVLYEMLAGERPFKAPDERNESLRIRGEPAPPIGRRAPGLSAGIERIVQHCLEKLPSQRFDAAELCAALERVASELGLGDLDTAVARALSATGFVTTYEPSRPPSRQLAAPAPSRMTLGRALLGLVAASLLLAGGGAVIQLLSRRGDALAGALGGASRLELAPRTPAHLRVVAHPWAHVSVDGQHVETTPFARPIPLSAGTHYVRLDHPNAPSERRTIRLGPGETLLLDVTLKVSAPPVDAGESRPLLGDAGVDDASP